MKKTTLRWTAACAAMLLSLGSLSAQELPEGLTLPDLPEDTLVVKKKVRPINDYSLIGVEYGVMRNQMSFNPSYYQEAFYTPGYYGVTYTRYCRMMNMFPYFALQVGAFYGQEGYRFKQNPDTGYIHVLEGGTGATYKVVEVPVMAQFHADMEHFKIMAMVGPYGGYRLSVDRIGQQKEDEYTHAFMEHDHRLDYGLHGGAGFALVFSPVELHINLRVRYSWSNLFDPDFYSPYYYRFAYPFDFMLTAGVHFQLSKRYGKTRSDIRRDARDHVYNSSETVDNR